MEVTANIKRADLVHLLVMVNIKSALQTILTLSLFIFAYLVITQNPSNLKSWLTALTSSLIASPAALIIMLIISSIVILLNSNKKSGVLGKHIYSLSEEGLHEVTIANESLNKWNGIESLTITKNYIIFKINGYLYHIIPKRDFANDAEFNNFWGKANELFRKST